MTDDRRDEVAVLLGRQPRGRFEVVVRNPAGQPTVIRNDPLLDDGIPMPTRWWLVDPVLRVSVDRLEAAGGVAAAEAAVDPTELAAAHARYAAERATRRCRIATQVLVPPVVWAGRVAA